MTSGERRQTGPSRVAAARDHDHGNAETDGRGGVVLEEGEVAPQEHARVRPQALEVGCMQSV